MNLWFHVVQGSKRCVLKGRGQGVRIFFHPQKCNFSLGVPEAEGTGPPIRTLVVVCFLTPTHTGTEAFRTGGGVS